MTEEQSAEYITLGHEYAEVEFKGPGLRSDKQLVAKVARAVLGMANRRNGGVSILGVDDVGGMFMPSGMTPEQVGSWMRYDEVADALNAYADPPL